MSIEHAMMPESGWLRRYIDLYTPMSEAPAEAHFAAGLALLSAAIGHRGYVEWSRSREPLTVWVVLEGQSAAARKTTSSGTALALARRVCDANDDDEAPLRARRISHTSDRGLIELVAPKDEHQRDQWKDGHGYPPGVLVEWDEFGGVLGNPGDVKGSDWIGRIQTTLMMIYGGRHGGIQTGSGKLPDGRCAMSIIATMTRAELEQRVSSGLLKTGFMGRFVLIPFAGRDSVLSRPPRWTMSHEAKEGELAMWLNELTHSQQSFGDAFDRLTDDAGARWDDWYTTRTAELEQIVLATGDDEDSAIFAAFNRLQTTAMKVAACLAISEWDRSTPLDQVQIEASHVEHGTALAEFALAEFKSLLSHESFGRTSEYQNKIKAFLVSRNGSGPISMRDLITHVRGRGMDYMQRKQAIWALHPEEVICEETNRGKRNERTMVSLSDR